MTERYCPYLGLVDDPETRAAYPSPRNYCHRAVPTQKVDPAYQRSTCIRKVHQRCPVYQEGWKGKLPPDIRMQGHKAGFGYRYALIALAAVALIGIAFIVSKMGGGVSFDALLSPRVVTPQPTVSRPSATVPTQRATLSPTASSTSQATETPQERPTKTTAPTASPTVTSIPTAGPGLETRFGPNDQFLIHFVQEGESFYSLARRYNTSERVIKETNNLLVEDTLWMGINLLLVPGRENVGGLPEFDVLYINQPVTVGEITDIYNVTAEDIRYYNELGSGSVIQSDRWLIIPLQE